MGLPSSCANCTFLVEGILQLAQVPGLAQGQIAALAGSTDWPAQARNVLLFGPSELAT